MKDSEIAHLVAEAKKNHKKPSFIDYPRFTGDPVKFLVGLYTMMRDPKRAEFAFDHEDLQWLADVFEQAAIVAHGDEEFERERRKFQSMCDELKGGMLERKEVVAAMFMESHDWPRTSTVIKAARLLEYADIRGIH